MALATRCPHCKTTFRVAHDQLKLRAGIVRCGACNQIFNGVEHLLRPDDATPATAPSAVPAAPPQEKIAGAGISVAATDMAPPAAIESEPVFPLEPAAEFSDQVDFDISYKPFNSASELETALPQSMAAALDDARHDAPIHAPINAEASPPEPYVQDQIATEQGAAELRPDQQSGTPFPPALHATEAAAISDAEEPSFVKRGRQQRRWGRIARMVMYVACVILLTGLLAQGAYIFRAQLASRFPAMKSMLAQGCITIGCRIDLPAQIEAVAIESSELQTVAANKNIFSLTVLLRNHSALAQTWPSIELTLNDANEQAIARRVFMPRDYLPPAQDMAKGFAPDSEYAVKLFFTLSQLKASGYRVYLFYP